MAQDSSLQEFWDTRYQQNVTPWESRLLPPDFEGQVQALRALASTVLIPGCGAAYEIQYLLQQGLDVHAIDFSSEAVTRAREHLGAAADRVQQADFFAPALCGQWDWVYERAFLCALPPARWADYAEKMAGLVKPGGVLAGYFFLRPTPKGPPFGAELASLETLFQPFFSLRKQCRLTGSLPVFAPDEYWLEWVRKP